MRDLRSVWESALDIIRRQLNTPTFKTWFENTHPVSMDSKSLTISAPNSFAKDWLETRYSSLISDALHQVTGDDLQVLVVVGDSDSADNPAHREEIGNDRPVGRREAQALNPKYTFDSFVIGSSNRFAHAAALAVAEKPSQAYNPLFIYGGVGLGKTHLLQAIAHYINQQYPGLKVRYVSCEKFLNDFVASIRDKDKIIGFQKRYRDNDVLLVDDIQFLERKE